MVTEKNRTSNRLIGITLLCIGLGFTFSCEDQKGDPLIAQTSKDIQLQGQTETIEQIASRLNAKEAEPANLIEKTDDNESSGRVNTSNTNCIHFGDKAACILNPDICNNTFVGWPGYIQSIGTNEYGYAWMSYGPRKDFIPISTGDHYHISGFLFPDIEPNPRHTAMFGYDWFAFYMKRSGEGMINFDLTQIKVCGDVPITLWFKKDNGSWKYWASLKPGLWNLPGATNIKELHIRATSADKNDKYSIDDIKVKASI